MSKLDCPVTPGARTIGYIHGWNKTCSHSLDCLPYPDWYDGSRYSAKGTILPPVVRRRRKASKPRKAKVVQVDEYLQETSPAPAAKPRRKNETTESKLARARKRLLDKGRSL